MIEHAYRVQRRSVLRARRDLGEPPSEPKRSTIAVASPPCDERATSCARRREPLGQSQGKDLERRGSELAARRSLDPSDRSSAILRRSGDARPPQTSDEAYGLVALKVRGGVLTVPAPPTPVAERRRIRVIASDVSLTREPPRSKFDPQRPAQANVPGRLNIGPRRQGSKRRAKPPELTVAAFR